MPYAIYLRKSRADVELEKIEKYETLARHKKILLDLARKKELEVSRIYEEIVSGESIRQRPEMQKLLQDVSNELYEGVLVMEVERLARGNTRDQGIVAETFQYSGTKIITPNKVYDPNNDLDQEYFEFGLFMSRREYKTIQRRLNTGRVQSVNEGNYIGSVPPYGYDIVHPDRKTYTLAFNDETPYVQMMKNWRLHDHLTAGEIAQKLTDMNIPTRKGNREWNKATIIGILTNPVYAGYVKWNSRKAVKKMVGSEIQISRPRAKEKDILMAQGKHPALFTDEEHQQLVQSFDIGSARKPKDKPLVNPLAGLLFCKHCGKAFVYRKYKGCRDRYVHNDSHFCKVKSAAVEDVIETLINMLKVQIQDFTFKLKNSSESGLYEQRQLFIQEIEKQLEEAQKKQSKLYDFLEREIYSEEEFISRKKILAGEINQLIDQLKELKSQAIAPIDYEKHILLFQKCIDTLNDDSLPIKAKNILLKSIISRIEYDREDDKIQLDIHFL